MIIRIATLAALVLLTTAPAVTAQEQPRTGGVLKAGLIGEAPTLDLHATTAVITQQITWHMHETLYTYDRNLNPIPMLAEGHVVGDTLDVTRKEVRGFKPGPYLYFLNGWIAK